MPEVKWVTYINLHNEQTPGLESYQQPVLTLDQIEAWLKDELMTAHIGSGYGIHLYERLLAQVQAWKASVK